MASASESREQTALACRGNKECRVSKWIQRLKLARASITWRSGIFSICIFIPVFLGAHFFGISVAEKTVSALSCFNNQSCWQIQNGFPRIRTEHPTISWDMDSSSFSTEWGWKDVAPGVNFEDAANHASFEWTKGNLSWDQKDSCNEARFSGNGTVCVGMRNWCKWLGGNGIAGMTSRFAVARTTFQSGCDLPDLWRCADETSVRLNGYMFWKQGECGVGTINVSELALNHPDPNGTGDPRLKDKCKGRSLPVLTKRANAKHVMVHEFGHGVHLYDLGFTCLPEHSVMEGYRKCELVLPCPSQFTTASDELAVRYLYGP